MPGVGTASDACLTMEQGVDGILMNTALAEARDPVAMAWAMRHAVDAGRPAYLAGRMPRREVAVPSIARPRHARVGDVGPVIAPRVDASPQGPQMTASKGLAPRRAALNVLAQVRQGRPLDAALDGALKKLDEADRRLAHEMVAGVLRRQQALDARLAALVRRGNGPRCPSRLQDLLRLGAYQLVALDRVPAHAAVDTSVSLAREEGGPRAGGFVNAVLRRLGGAARGHGSGGRWSCGSLGCGSARPASLPSALAGGAMARAGSVHEETSRLLEWNDRRPRLVLQPARRSARRPGATLDGRPASRSSPRRTAPGW